ncbi:hypothetical protein WR25_08126 [Diploscapter pachys]|uniref:Uncharacterized protein n=1 Tax=Diploscapter pachys TaxID=2018661 RepID=A0A2A2JLA3_9BILA|nr:hypothetical protein WR25_08126 [Diploscapter pachys]
MGLHCVCTNNTRFASKEKLRAGLLMDPGRADPHFAGLNRVRYSAFGGMFLSGLPVESITMCAECLTFEEAEKLAWTNQRLIEIVRRNMPMALEPKMQFKRPVTDHFPA